MLIDTQHLNQTKAVVRVSEDGIWHWSLRHEIHFNCHNGNHNTSSLPAPPMSGRQRSSVQCVVSAVTLAAELYSHTPNHDPLCLSSRSQKTCQAEHFYYSGMFHMPPSAGCCRSLMCDLSKLHFSTQKPNQAQHTPTCSSFPRSPCPCQWIYIAVRVSVNEHARHKVIKRYK